MGLSCQNFNIKEQTVAMHVTYNVKKLLQYLTDQMHLYFKVDNTF
jgi:hypothetical protein